MKIYKKITDTIGGTPLVELKNLEKELNLKAKLVAKVESFNPGGSVKDRIAFAMIEDAEKQGLINKDTVLIEPTSGNTGIGLAMVAASKGLRLIIAMPETMSIERRNLMKAYGAELVLTEGAKGINEFGVSLASSSAFAILSLTLPPGLNDSTFATSLAFKLYSFSKFLSSTRGVPPIVSIIFP